MSGTLLTDAKAAFSQTYVSDEKAIEIADTVRQLWYDAYSSGEIDFVRFCENVQNSLSEKKGIPAFQRQKKLGAAVEAALKCMPPKRTPKSRRSRPASLQQICYDLVRLAADCEKLPITRGSKKGNTAFERACEVLNSAGVKITSSAVERAYSEHIRAIRSKSE